MVKPVTMKKKIIIGLIFCAMLLGIFMADDWQQRRFATLRYGYQCMEQCQYEDAVTAFEKYLDVNSDIYWHLLEAVNRDERYYRENVNDSLEECLRILANQNIMRIKQISKNKDIIKKIPGSISHHFREFLCIQVIFCHLPAYFDRLPKRHLHLF